MLVDRANILLDALNAQLVSEAEVRSWAESEMMSINDAGDIPSWLLDLVQHGPKHVVESGHEWRSRPSFRTLFASHAMRVDLADHASVERFARWLAKAAMGEDLALPEVELGYIVDHHLDDLGDLKGAVGRVRQDLPPLIQSWRDVVSDILGYAG